ncbi:HD domain-containing protein [Streptomyces sp. ME03-5709C]|nr:HD domain-containing protein [Streptomyces sp. ME03-5709C]
MSEGTEVLSENIAGVEVPGTAAVAEATRLMREMTSPLIHHHSRRVLAFGVLHARRPGLKPDPELLHLSAMFHDTGLSTPFSDAEQRFEVDGAHHARTFMLDRDQVDEITGAHPRDDSKNDFPRAYVEGLTWRPETPNGTVNAEVLEHFVPGFRRTTTVELMPGAPWPS